MGNPIAPRSPASAANGARVEVCVLCHVRNPRGLAAGPDPARQTNAAREGHRAGSRLEFPERLAGGVPDFQTAKHVALAIHGPDFAGLPLAVFGNGLKNLRSSLVQRVGLGQNAGDLMVRGQRLLGFPALPPHLCFLQLALVGETEPDERLHLEPFLSDEIVGVARPGLLPVRDGAVEAAALAEHVMLGREAGSSTKPLAGRRLAEGGVPPPPGGASK